MADTNQIYDMSDEELLEIIEAMKNNASNNPEDAWYGDNL